MPFDVSAATCCVGQRGATLKLFITQQTFFSPRIVRLTPWLTSAFWQGANVWLWRTATLKSPIEISNFADRA